MNIILHTQFHIFFQISISLTKYCFLITGTDPFLLFKTILQVNLSSVPSVINLSNYSNLSVHAYYLYMYLYGRYYKDHSGTW